MWRCLRGLVLAAAASVPGRRFLPEHEGIVLRYAIFEDISNRNAMIIAGKCLLFLLLSEGGRTSRGRSAFIKFCG